MKRSTKGKSTDIGDSPRTRVKRRTRRTSQSGKSAANKPGLGSGIREVEEARALLQDQLQSLYWWVFNAFKMKGFIRAKGLDELQRKSANGEEPHIEKGDFPEEAALAEERMFQLEGGQVH